MTPVLTAAKPSCWRVRAWTGRTSTLPDREGRRKSGSQWTPRWREEDSNPRSPVKDNAFSRPPVQFGIPPSAGKTGSFGTETRSLSAMPTKNVIGPVLIRSGDPGAVLLLSLGLWGVICLAIFSLATAWPDSCWRQSRQDWRGIIPPARQSATGLFGNAICRPAMPEPSVALNRIDD
jgi:hypothetical protein